MKKVLIIGMSSILGGVETYIYNLIRFSNIEKYHYDFLIVGERKSVFEEEINRMFNDGENHFYYCPNMKYHFIAGYKWLKQFYKTHSYDCIYMNTCTCAKYLYCIKGLNKTVKLISHSHSGSGDSKINNGVFSIFVNKRSNYKLACSDLAGKWLYGKKCRNFIVVPNGVDTDRFKYNEQDRIQIRKELNISNEEFIIGHVGRFNVTKNHDFFIEMARKLPNKYVFLLIGDGETKEPIQNRISELKLDKRFRILPSTNTIERYYNAMDVFMMPSFYEGLPIVSVEAQTNGLNCLFSDSVSLDSDLSNHCEFIALDNQEEWKNKILQLKKTRYDGVREIIKRKFDIKSTVKIIENLFDK